MGTMMAKCYVINNGCNTVPIVSFQTFSGFQRLQVHPSLASRLAVSSNGAFKGVFNPSRLCMGKVAIKNAAPPLHSPRGKATATPPLSRAMM